MMMMKLNPLPFARILIERERMLVGRRTNELRPLTCGLGSGGASHRDVDVDVLRPLRGEGLAAAAGAVAEREKARPALSANNGVRCERCRFRVL